MLLLTSANDFVQIGVSVSAVAIDAHVSWVDTSNAGAITPGRKNSTTTTAGLMIIAPAPPASTQRNIKTMNIRNKHATDPCQITVYHYDGTTNELLFDTTLQAGKTLDYTDTGGFRLT